MILAGSLIYGPIAWGVANYVVDKSVETLNRRIDDLNDRVSDTEKRLVAKLDENLQQAVCDVIRTEIKLRVRQFEQEILNSSLGDLKPESEILSGASLVLAEFKPYEKTCKESGLQQLRALRAGLNSYAVKSYENAIAHFSDLKKEGVIYHYLMGAALFGDAKEKRETVRTDLWRGTLKQAVAHSNSAFELAKRKLGASPSHWSVRKLKCNVLMMGKQDVEAVKCLNSLLTRTNRGVIYYNLCAVNSRIGKHKEAMQACREMIHAGYPVCRSTLLDDSDFKTVREGPLRADFLDFEQSLAC